MSLGANRVLYIWRDGVLLYQFTNLMGGFGMGYPYMMRLKGSNLFYTCDEGIYVLRLPDGYSQETPELATTKQFNIKHSIDTFGQENVLTEGQMNINTDEPESVLQPQHNKSNSKPSSTATTTTIKITATNQNEPVAQTTDKSADENTSLGTGHESENEGETKPSAPASEGQ